MIASSSPVSVDSPYSAPASRPPYALEHLSDEELFAGTRRMITRSNHHLASLLAHLGEVEARGIHRQRACSSLYTYCIYELRLSEDMAYRHARAAKLARQFPIVFEQLAAGEIHLTGLLLLGPHLTQENHRAVLARAKYRSKREIEKLVRWLDPLPEVPAKVEPLGPAPLGVRVENATWQDFVAALNPVRDLPSGQRPKDWLDSEADADTDARTERSDAGLPSNRWSELDGVASPESDGVASPESAVGAALDRGPAAQRYKVQFTANEEYVRLLERARDLLSHAVPSRSIEEVHLRAMRALVAQLEKRRYARKDATKSQATAEADKERTPAGARPSPCKPESSARESGQEAAFNDPRQRD